MNAETRWYIKTFRCRNGVEEKIKYSMTPRPRWSRRDMKRAARREARRADGAEHIMARGLNQNFDAGRDLHLVLELSPDGMERVEKRAAGLGHEREEDAVLKALSVEVVNFIRRVQRRTGAAELRYYFACSDREKEPKTGELRPARPHVHLVVNAEAMEAVREKWGLGAVMEKELYTVKGDFHALAEYILQQTRHVDGMNRYTPSRNLAKAQESEPVLVTRGGESLMRCPRGCVELYHSLYQRGKNQYMRYLRPSEQRGDAGGG
jgi:hypothetical protein